MKKTESCIERKGEGETERRSGRNIINYGAGFLINGLQMFEVKINTLPIALTVSFVNAVL